MCRWVAGDTKSVGPFWKVDSQGSAALPAKEPEQLEMIASSYTGQVQNLVTFGWWCIKPKVKLQHAHEELTAGFCMCVLACIALQHVCCLEPDCMCAKKLNLNLNLNVTDLHANIDQLQSLLHVHWIWIWIWHSISWIWLNCFWPPSWSEHESWFGRRNLVSEQNKYETPTKHGLTHSESLVIIITCAHRHSRWIQWKTDDFQLRFRLKQ